MNLLKVNNKKFFIFFLSLAFLALSFPVLASSATIERIASADQIKYFKVVKQEGGTLYGIRIASPKIETNLERIPSPDQIKYFRVMKNENGTLYGIRIASPKVEATLEKIPSADQIKYFRVVKREGGALYGIRLYSDKNLTEIDGKIRMTQGIASWYKYKNGLFAASPDYPKGSVLKVTNLANNKSVEVTVNDYGPDRNIHPDRVIDLDYVAFSEIASPGAGLISVKVEPVSIYGSNFFPEAEDISLFEPSVEALAAIVIRESDGQIIYEKNADKVMPIASLTKLVFAKVFLDLKPDFNKVVTYKYQDEEYNYEYCEKWESARLRVADGDTLKIGDLVYSSLIGSANNTVETLVRNSGLTRAQFIAKMNEYVKILGANNTKFVEPTGLSTENVSSPFDYAIIVKEIFNDQRIREISSHANYSFATINTEKAFNLKNTNHLLGNAEYSITGSKTGFLNEAGYCLVTQVSSASEKYIVITFNSKTRDISFSDNEKLIKFSLKK